MVAIRPTTVGRSPRRTRTAVGVAVGVVAVLVGALVLAAVADGDGSYPGARSGVPRARGVAVVAPPPNAAVDGFEVAGPIGTVGDLSWTAESGTFTSDGSFAIAPDASSEAPAVALVDPGAEELMGQVDVFRPVAGSGIVFRWAGPDDHWAATVAPGGEHWQLVRVVAGRPQVMATAPGPTHGQTVGFRTDASTVELVVAGRVRATIRDVPTTGTATGIVSTGPDVRLDQFAVLEG